MNDALLNPGSVEVFGRPFSVPEQVRCVFRLLELLDGIKSNVDQSITRLFDGGILKNARGFGWAVCCTPDKKDDSSYYSVCGLLNCADLINGVGDVRLGKRGLLESMKDDRPHIGRNVMDDVRAAFVQCDLPIPSGVEVGDCPHRAEAVNLAAMMEAYYEALPKIKEYRLQKACDSAEVAERRTAAAEAPSDGSFIDMRVAVKRAAALGGVVGLGLVTVGEQLWVKGSQWKASHDVKRSEKDVTAWNISSREESEFLSVLHFEEWATGFRKTMTDWYGEFFNDLAAGLSSADIPGWGGGVREHECRADEIAQDAGFVHDEQRAYEYMICRPYDVSVAVALVTEHGERAAGLREVVWSKGDEWLKNADERVKTILSNVNFEDEEALKATRNRFESVLLPCLYGGDSSLVCKSLEKMDRQLEHLDLLARTVGDFVCTTREAASVSRGEQDRVDQLMSECRIYPFGSLEESIAVFKQAGFLSEYAADRLNVLMKRREFILTVAGVVYGSYAEAEKAFEEKADSVVKNKTMFSVVKVCSFGKTREALLMKYWPGALDPESFAGKMRSGDVVGVSKIAFGKMAQAMRAVKEKAVSAMKQDTTNGDETV